MYLSRGGNQTDTPPHDHKTWAVVVGISGEEINRFYERDDDGSIEGRAELRLVHEEVVRAGTGVCLMPEDIHSVHLPATALKAIHMYGKAVTEMQDRLQFDLDSGGVGHYPPPHDIR